MNNDFSLTRILQNSWQAICDNFNIFANMAVLLMACNYLCLYLEDISENFIVLRILWIYVFSYAFLRIYFNERPIFDKEIFLKSLGKMGIILLLEFAAILCLRFILVIAYLGAKSMMIFPDIYQLLQQVYLWSKPMHWMIVLVTLFVVSCFGFFIPTLAWTGTLLGKDSSILFALIETRSRAAKILLLYMALFVILPISVVALFRTGALPLSIVLFLSSVITIIQLVVYAEMYRSLALFSRFVK